MINWPRVDTGKPHMYWRGRWYVQASRYTNPILFGDALRWSAERAKR